MATTGNGPPGDDLTRQWTTPLPAKDPVQRWWPVVREILLFAAGLYGVRYEAIVQQAERPLFLALYTAMMGLPAIVPLFGKGKGAAT